MKAAQYRVYGDTSVTEIVADAPVPEPVAGQVQVQVYAAGINPIDAAIRSGYLKDKIPLPFPVTLGGDFSGIVSKVGDGVSGVAVGDQVFGIANPLKGGSGSTAEFVVARTGNIAKKPTSVDHVNAAALPLAGTSALQGIEEHMHIGKGQHILIHGGAGGIGSLAIQIAKARGAFVAATASTDDAAFVKEIGADMVIDYKREDFTRIVSGYDAVFDTAGGDIANRSIPVVKPGGIVVSMTGQPDPEIARRYQVTAIAQGTNGTTKQLDRVAKLVDSGVIAPVIDRTYPLEQTRAAYERLASHPRGKVVIAVR